ncbi:hypothetical protein AC792_02020 [Arthrobacter sp. RIT-PI-e]|nr:hypothetical protein AC792_02020 [Arthrobacter sp. RIT-PI-e]
MTQGRPKVSLAGGTGGLPGIDDASMSTGRTPVQDAELLPFSGPVYRREFQAIESSRADQRMPSTATPR